MTIEITSKRDNLDKAVIALKAKAKKLGFTKFGDVTRDLVTDSGNGKIYQYDMEVN